VLPPDLEVLPPATIHYLGGSDRCVTKSGIPNCWCLCIKNPLVFLDISKSIYTFGKKPTPIQSKVYPTSNMCHINTQFGKNALYVCVCVRKRSRKRKRREKKRESKLLCETEQAKNHLREKERNCVCRFTCRHHSCQCRSHSLHQRHAHKIYLYWIRNRAAGNFCWG